MVGFYGVGGIGKTTMCKTLCNELLQEFEGEVSHVELSSQIASTIKWSWGNPSTSIHSKFNKII